MSNGHFSADSPQKSVSSRRIVTVAVICVLVLALAAVSFLSAPPSTPITAGWPTAFPSPGWTLAA